LRRFHAILTDWSEAIQMKQINFVDTTERDGSLSLWALGMRTGANGFESMEFFGFAGYIKYVKEHKENPWVWMGEGAKKFRRTRVTTADWRRGSRRFHVLCGYC
jgi:pyruvate/oxaloacetate carboxyltransferase